jgi:hypothetical protein
MAYFDEQTSVARQEISSTYPLLDYIRTADTKTCFWGQKRAFGELKKGSVATKKRRIVNSR